MELRVLSKLGSLTDKKASYIDFRLHKDNTEYTVLSPMEYNGKPVCLEMHNGYDFTMLRGLEYEIEKNTKLREVIVHTNLNVDVLQELPMYIRLKDLADKNKVKLIIEFDDFMLDELQAARLGWDSICIRRERKGLLELAEIAKRCNPCYVRLRMSEHDANEDGLKELRKVSEVLVDT